MMLSGEEDWSGHPMALPIHMHGQGHLALTQAGGPPLHLRLRKSLTL